MRYFAAVCNTHNNLYMYILTYIHIHIFICEEAKMPIHKHAPIAITHVTTQIPTIRVFRPPPPPPRPLRDPLSDEVRAKQTQSSDH